MQKILKTKIEDKIHISWDINYNCNYRCSYCYSYETGWDKTSFEKAIIALDNLQVSILKKTSLPITIWFTGGEPVILPWFEDFCLYIKGINPRIKIGLSTNGSQTEEYYSNLFNNSLVDFATFSLHFEFAKPSHFIKKVQSLVDKHGKNKISVVIMTEKSFEDKALELLKSLKNKRVNVSTHIIRHHEYTNTEKGLNVAFTDFDSNIKDVEIDGVEYNSNYLLDYMHVNNHSFKDWKCWAGVHHFYISRFFDLLAGSCRIKSFGNLLKDDINFDGEPVVCDGRPCICTSNLKIKKEYTKISK